MRLVYFVVENDSQSSYQKVGADRQWYLSIILYFDSLSIERKSESSMYSIFAIQRYIKVRSGRAN